MISKDFYLSRYGAINFNEILKDKVEHKNKNTKRKSYEKKSVANKHISHLSKQDMINNNISFLDGLYKRARFDFKIENEGIEDFSVCERYPEYVKELIGLNFEKTDINNISFKVLSKNITEIIVTPPNNKYVIIIKHDTIKFDAISFIIKRPNKVRKLYKTNSISIVSNIRKIIQNIIMFGE